MTQHVLRVTVPWRTVSVGECGKTLSDDDAAITVDDLTQRIADHGEARAEFSLCPQCWSRARQALRWETDPVGVLAREMQHGNRELLCRELHAIAALIEQHHDEYAGRMAGLASAVDLTAHRRRRRRI